jgi:predicted hotdog family 3-hydroxylacyl-ACP dehydratase
MTDPDPAAPTGTTHQETPAKAQAQAPGLAERYGRARPGSQQASAQPGGSDRGDDPWDESDGVRPRPKLSVGARIAVALALAAGVAIAAWFTIVDTQRDPVTFTDVGFSVVSPEEVEVTFDVSMPPGTEAVCTVTALSKNFAEVGAVDVEVAADAARTTRHTVTIATTELATTGVVDHCDQR